LEWLHQGCENDLSLDFLSFGAGDFPFKTPFKKVAISHAVARSSIVFCNSISRCRSVMAASKLLGAAAACVILLSFAAGHRKSYWSGCIKAAIIVCEQIFPILALEIFLVKFPFKSASKYFFSLWHRDPVLELQFLLSL